MVAPFPRDWPRREWCDRRAKNEACKTCRIRVYTPRWRDGEKGNFVVRAADEVKIQGTPAPGLQYLAQEPQTQHIVIGEWPLSDITRYADIVRIAREMAVPMVFPDNVDNFRFRGEFWDVAFRDLNLRRPCPEGCQVNSRTPNCFSFSSANDSNLIQGGIRRASG